MQFVEHEQVVQLQLGVILSVVLVFVCVGRLEVASLELAEVSRVKTLEDIESFDRLRGDDHGDL